MKNIKKNNILEKIECKEITFNYNDFLKKIIEPSRDKIIDKMTVNKYNK